MAQFSWPLFHGCFSWETTLAKCFNNNKNGVHSQYTWSQNIHVGLNFNHLGFQILPLIVEIHFIHVERLRRFDRRSLWSSHLHSPVCSAFRE